MEKKLVEIHFEEIPEEQKYTNLINTVLEKAFKEEGLENINVYMNVILTTPGVIRKTNREFRNIDKETDVLSFPMFEKEEIESLKNRNTQIQEVLGDIMISIDRVKEQAEEYGHSFERELSYMLVHGFYHILGYDHITEEDKVRMRKKEEKILKLLGINRD